jgi:hypothetical protein
MDTNVMIPDKFLRTKDLFLLAAHGIMSPTKSREQAAQQMGDVEKEWEYLVAFPFFGASGNGSMAWQHNGAAGSLSYQFWTSDIFRLIY